MGKRCKPQRMTGVAGADSQHLLAATKCRSAADGRERTAARLGRRDGRWLKLWKTRQRHIETKKSLWKSLRSTCEDAHKAPLIGIEREREEGSRQLIHKEVPKSCVFPTLLHRHFHRGRQGYDAQTAVSNRVC